VAAGLATLRVLRDEPIHARAAALATRLNQGLVAATAAARVPACVQQVGSMLTLFFTEGPIRRMEDIPPSAPARFGAFWRGMRDAGVMLPPSQYEAWFVSGAHDEALIDRTVAAAGEVMASW